MGCPHLLARLCQCDTRAAKKTPSKSCAEICTESGVLADGSRRFRFAARGGVRGCGFYVRKQSQRTRRDALRRSRRKYCANFL